MRLVYITLGWAAGIILAANILPIPNIAWLIFAAVILVALWLVRQRRSYRLLMLALLAFAFGGWRYSFVPTSSDVARYTNLGGLTIEGVVSDEPDVRDDRVQLRVAAESVTRAGQTVTTSGLALVQAPRLTDARYGDRIKATGVLAIPASGDTFSYADYLARSGVYTLMPDAAVEVVSSGHGIPFFNTLYDLKSRLNAVIARNLPEPEAALLSGILLGVQRGIAPEIDDAFSKVGASHVIAISGFNMVIVSGVVMGFLSRITTRRWLAALIGVGVIVVYTLLVGAGASVIRAAIMSGLLVVAPLLRRKTYVPASLAFVVLAMSLVDPNVLWDVSFQLSVFATLGITLFTQSLSARFESWLHHWFPAKSARSAGDFLGEPIIVSISAQITTLPLIILYFGQVSLVFLIVNLLILPMQSALMLLGALATFATLVVPLIGQVLHWIDMLLLAWTIGVVRLFASLPFASVEFHADSRWIALFLLVVIGGALVQATFPRWWSALGRLVQRRGIVLATAFSGFAIVFLTGAVFVSRPDGKLHVWWLDVGPSNAILMQSPGGAQMLVDGGRLPSRLLTALGDRLPFNDRQIEVLVVTQPDEFDYAALPDVLARYDVGAAIMNGQPNVSDTYQQLQSALSSTDVVNVRAGYTLDFDDGVHLQVLNPVKQPQLGDSLNDNALVLRVSYGDISFLLPSDLSEAGQTKLLQSGELLVSTVMQLPNHGTIRSLEADFVKTVQPQVVILQSDRANRIGDPNPDTLKLLGDTPLLRTDQGGTIHLWTDGHELWSVQES
jgi:competence protein ComEC